MSAPHRRRPLRPDPERSPARLPGRFRIDGDRIDYRDDLGFWAYEEFQGDELHHAGHVMKQGWPLSPSAPPRSRSWVRGTWGNRDLVAVAGGAEAGVRAASAAPATRSSQLPPADGPFFRPSPPYGKNTSHEPQRHHERRRPRRAPAPPRRSAAHPVHRRDHRHHGS
ncbi:Atu4866 domain-containing protein [Streptomyces griseorubiginosus]|uniref:Atu4866 domain-containing protein n=1 Tax=Streptomyces griseorubiginosus TaxID=67304 RepID=UPI0036E2B278